MENTFFLNEGFKQAKAITKKTAKSFYFASRFLPKEKRNAAYAVYAICRLSDDSVDNCSFAAEEQLKIIKDKIQSCYSNETLTEPILTVFHHTVNKYKIPKQYFDELTAAMSMDLEKNRYAGFSELYTYCWRAAGVVGLIMLKIFTAKNPKAQKSAADLGVAMQLTNILRDIKEDFGRGRIYLPQDEMNRFNITEENISQAKIDANFISFMKQQISRARQYYDNSAEGIKMINNISCRLTVCLMKNIYAGILGEIENNNYNIFKKRIYVPARKKISIALSVILGGKYL